MSRFSLALMAGFVLLATWGYADSRPPLRSTRVEAARIAPPKAPADAKPALSHFSDLRVGQRKKLEAMLTREVQQTVNKMGRLDGQKRNVSVYAKVDQEKDKVYLYFDIGFLPKINGGEWEDQSGAIDNLLYYLLSDHFVFRGTRFLFDGKEIEYYYPDPTIKGEKKVLGPIGRKTETPLVVVSPGHGWYYNYEKNAWALQRDPYNGVTEDLLTPVYADELAGLLAARSLVSVENDVRSHRQDMFPRAQKPWNQMAARYNLQDRFPLNLDICCSFRNKSDYPLKEYDNDIRSRPLLANHLNASALISLHSNAFTDPAVRGTRVYVYAGRADSTELATKILCSMKEEIHANSMYADFPVGSSPSDGDHGENRLAQMPSVIVETAFHTNPQDAAALLDPAFRLAAMKGVEKGYRLFRDNKPCVPLAITAIPNAQGPHKTNIPISVYFSGNPQFPINVQTTTIVCPSNWTCINYSTNFSQETASPVTFNVRCDAPSNIPTATFGVRTVITDADGVVSNAFDHQYTCQKP